MKAGVGITEELNASNQMKRIGHMNICDGITTMPQRKTAAVALHK